MARSRVATQKPGANARRVVVKAHALRMNATGAKAAALHLRYIEREGVERDGSRGVLYTGDGPARTETLEQPRVGEKHQFRLIVSPEDAGDLDLMEYVRRLMAQVERDLGRKLEWAAVNHYNTDHTHAHIVVRGVDRDGRQVRLDRGYISNGLRARAQEIATEELGPRREIDLRRTRAREIGQDRLTSLDREIERRAHQGRIEVRSPNRGARVDDSTLVARLEHLETLRLAERVSANAWTLSAGWQDQLRELGSRGDILKQIHSAIRGDPARYQIVKDGQAIEAKGAGALSGRVASKGLSDELKGSFYAVVETPSGRAYHLPLDARSAEAIRLGDIVSFTTKPESPVRPVDRTIADIARSHDRLVAPDAADTSSLVLARRLRELERLGLASADGANRWRVSPNLTDELERRATELPPRHRLLVHKEPRALENQVGHEGPVWLDRIKVAALAPHGFGAEVRRAIERRREVLLKLGIQPDDPNRMAKLRDLEGQCVARQFAARSGQVHLPSVPDGFRGRLQMTDPQAPAGSPEYAVVSDGSRFVVVRASTVERASDGRTVTVTRDGKGRAVVRPSRDTDLAR
jgi:type IV secretory pathway VirD2 relaxase